MILANARHVKNLPGRKTDMSDAEWLATLLRNGLIRGSFIPPRPIRELRDLTRYRVQLIQDQTKVKNRTHKLLEDVNIKLSGVVSDMFGVSGLSMLRLIAKGGLVDPLEIASMAVGILKRKFTQLTEAAYGRLSEHHCIVLQHLLDQYDASQSSIKTIEALIEEKAKPYQQHINLLCTIPGIGWHSAVAILAETGVDMSVFPTHRHISSWAGLCPGNNESAGKHHSGRTTHGNRYLKSNLCQVAWAASRTKNTYLAKRFWTMKARKGAKKALIAIAHKILIAVYHMLTTGESYRELGSDYLVKLKTSRTVSNMIRQLKILGYQVAAVPQERTAVSPPGS